MKVSLIICTYMRAQPLEVLLTSVKAQTSYPDEILIVDGSTNDETAQMIARISMPNLQYFKVDPEHRGLTRQRNFGIDQVMPNADIVCFLDDDTELEPDYFEKIVQAFESDPSIAGVGGVPVNENRWIPAQTGVVYNPRRYYRIGDHVIPEGQRNVIRNYLGLGPASAPGRMPEFSHGRTSGFPLTGDIHEVDLLIGLSFAFRKNVTDAIRFSRFFEGYGLYEDADYSIRAQRLGKLVIHTGARLNHYHDHSGRPNKYSYGKMVVRNGWYVWRVKYPNPSVKAKLKWHAIILLLAGIRLANAVGSAKKKEAFTESMGRFSGWFRLFFDKPKLE